MYKKTIKFFSLLVMALSIIMANTLLGQSKSKEFMDLLATAPTVEFMVKFNQEANRRMLYNDKYRAIWNGYVKDAEDMGMKNAKGYGLYFLHKYVYQTQAVPDSQVYNYRIADNGVDIIALNQAGGLRRLVQITELNPYQTIEVNTYVYMNVDFASQSFFGGAGANNQNSLNIINTDLVYYIFNKDKKRTYIYEDDKGNKWLLYDNIVYSVKIV